MSLAIVYSRANVGVKAQLVEVEVHLSSGLPSFAIVGLPEVVVKESKDRVRSAIMNSQFEFPLRRITVNLAPADLPKEGGRYDLAIALGILAATAQIPKNKLMEYEFGGELTLSGELRSFPGVLPMIVAAKEMNRNIILPKDNAIEGARVRGIDIFPAANLLTVCKHLQGTQLLLSQPYQEEVECFSSTIDFADVQGQYQAKRALEIAAAGGHSVIMRGPPGSGKTMLANRLPSILPEISEAEALEVMAIHSLHHQNKQISRNHYQRPFRAPHHSASSIALVGGGRIPKPGEVSLAHHGVLFLDELPEFSRSSLEALREPLEAGVVTISRAAYSVEYPAQFQFIAAMNPCPCGYWGDQERCNCHPEQVKRYQKRLSGPFIDRIDLHIVMSPVSSQLLLTKPQQVITSQEIKQRVITARQIQLQRAGCLNAGLSAQIMEMHCHLYPEEQAYLQQAIQKWGFSARACHRLLKVARTIADLAESEKINMEHLQEALLLKR